MLSISNCYVFVNANYSTNAYTSPFDLFQTVKRINEETYSDGDFIFFDKEDGTKILEVDICICPMHTYRYLGHNDSSTHVPAYGIIKESRKYHQDRLGTQNSRNEKIARSLMNKRLLTKLIKRETGFELYHSQQTLLNKEERTLAIKWLQPFYN